MRLHSENMKPFQKTCSNCNKECMKCVRKQSYTDGYKLGLAEGRKEKCFEQNNDGTIRPCEVMKDNEELKTKIENLKKTYKKQRNKRIDEIQKENARLKKEISVLLSCSNCPENKGGYICEKEYKDKCLAQKIEYIKELKEDNKDLCESLDIMNNRESELLEQIEKMKCCQNCKYEEMKISEEPCRNCKHCSFSDSKIVKWELVE